MAKITVDGVSYEASEGSRLLEALDALGVLGTDVDIPHYCWHPKLSVDGSCRMCQVELEGAPGLQIACDTPVRDGMVVRTRGEAVERAREAVMELLLVNHPLDCPICDQAGECRLQDYAFEYGLAHARTREPRRALKKRVELGPTIVFDQERCILCRRCVRFCDEVTGTGELGIVNRGDRSVIETFPGEPLSNAYSMNVADLCPVGALTTRDFRFKVRVWFLEEVPGLCTGCSKGCNVDVGVADGVVYRYTPRRNDAVNETWLCDDGRMSYREIGAADRITSAAVRGDAGQLVDASVDEAIWRAAERLRAAVETGGVACLASAHLTREDLETLRVFLDRLGAPDRGVPVVTGEPDGLLLQPERAANAAGARAAGFGDPAPVLERIRSGELGALLVFGHDVLDPAFLGSEAPLRDRGVILIDTHRSRLERVAEVVLPGRHLAEKGGTLINHAGIVQEVAAALEPDFPALAEARLVERLAATLGVSLEGEPEARREAG